MKMAHQVNNTASVVLNIHTIYTKALSMIFPAFEFE